MKKITKATKIRIEQLNTTCSWGEFLKANENFLPSAFFTIEFALNTKGSINFNAGTSGPMLIFRTDVFTHPSQIGNIILQKQTELGRLIHHGKSQGPRATNLRQQIKALSKQANELANDLMRVPGGGLRGDMPRIGGLP